MTDWREAIGTIWAYAANVWAYVADLFSTPERVTALFTAILAVSTIFLWLSTRRLWRVPSQRSCRDRQNCKCRRRRGADPRRAGEAAATTLATCRDTEQRRVDWYGRAWCDRRSLRDASRARAGHRFRTEQLWETYLDLRKLDGAEIRVGADQLLRWLR